MSAERNLEELLVPYARGELDPLQARWVSAQLSDEERQRVAAFGAAVQAVRESEPSLSDAHRDRLIGRLDSMAPRRSLPAAVWAIPVLALLVGFGFVLGWGASERTGAVKPAVAEELRFQDDEVPALEFAAKARNAITPHLRAIVSDDWAGRIDGDEKETHVRVDQGRIAFGFHGGDGRRLEVSTDHARIVVTGTRFSVAVNPSGTETEVAVSQGRVEVWRGRRRVEIAAGDRAKITTGGVSVRRARLAAVLDDPYLVEITRRKRSRRAIDFRGTPSVDVNPPRSDAVDLDRELNALERADAAAAAGRTSDAVAQYQTLISTARAPLVKSMARLGRARSLGNTGQLRIALGELRLLAKEPGEVGRQARLSMCSVQRRFLPCDSMRCYEALSNDADRELAAEARREAARSRQSGLRCDD
ncbi:MAG: FecR domain-containing protein [Myxococcota bacterium]